MSLIDAIRNATRGMGMDFDLEGAAGAPPTPGLRGDPAEITKQGADSSGSAEPLAWIAPGAASMQAWFRDDRPTLKGRLQGQAPAVAAIYHPRTAGEFQSGLQQMINDQTSRSDILNHIYGNGMTISKADDEKLKARDRAMREGIAAQLGVTLDEWRTSADVPSSNGTGPLAGHQPVPSTCDFIQLPQNPADGGYYTYGTPSRGAGQYGLPDAISLIEDLGEQRTFEPVGVGNISLDGGGKFSGHCGHRDGLSIDMRPIRSDRARAPTTWQNGSYDRDATQRLVDDLLSSGKVRNIFFNDPQINGVRPAPKHDNHLHVDVRSLCRKPL